MQKLGAEGNITQIAGTWPDDTEFKAQMATVDLVFISNFAHQNGGDLPNSVTFDTSTDPGALNRLGKARSWQPELLYKGRCIVDVCLLSGADSIC